MLRIFNPQIEFIGEVDDFQSCVITRKYNGIETLEMTIDITSKNVALLNKYNIVYAGDKKVFEILHRHIDNDEYNNLKIMAFGFGRTLAKRITIPPSNQGYDTVSGTRDAIVKHYISNNLTNPVNIDRQVSYIQCAAIQSGEEITDQTRLKNLGDEVTRVLLSDDLGYFFDLDMVNKKIIFDTYKGIDRSVSNTDDVSPVIFSLDLDNLLSQSYTDSMTTAQTQIYIGGQGEAENRTIIEIGESSSYERFEVFQDARDTDDETELINRGLSSLIYDVINFEAKIYPYGQHEYRVDYDLGDFVTLRSDMLGIILNTRITEIREIYQSGDPVQLEIVYGDKYPTFLTDIKETKKQINQLTTVESTSSPGVISSETYVHSQISPSAIWTVVHNLDNFPSVSIVDTANMNIIGDVEYTNSNELVIKFQNDFSGKAYLNV